MRSLGLIFVSLMVFLVATLSVAMEKEAVVIEVRKKIKLHDTEVVYPDYFINGGGKLGLDIGAVVSVVRRVPVHDPFQNASVGDFRIKVAEVEIIHADRDKSIARLLGVDRSAERPMVRYDSVMVGDRLDLSTLRRKVARVEPFLLPQEPKIQSEASAAPQHLKKLPVKKRLPASKIKSDKTNRDPNMGMSKKPKLLKP